MKKSCILNDEETEKLESGNMREIKKPVKSGFNVTLWISDSNILHFESSCGVKAEFDELELARIGVKLR